MKKNKKAMIASLALVGAVCVGSTLAYLSDQSNTLNNTFTVGKGYIPGDLGEAVWVDEKDYNGATEGEKTTTVDGELRTLDGNQYGTVDNKLEAGSVVTKDPVIRLTEESVESWVYMQVTYKTDDLYFLSSLTNLFRSSIEYSFKLMKSKSLIYSSPISFL